MTDQATLAALLHEIHGGGPCFARYRSCDLYAARLIAAGVTLAPAPPDALREVLDFIADWAHDCIGMDLPSSAYGFQEIEKMARAALGEQP